MKRVEWSDLKEGNKVYMKDDAGYFGPYEVVNKDLCYLRDEHGDTQYVSMTPIYMKEDDPQYCVTRTVFKGDNLYSDMVYRSSDRQKVKQYLDDCKIKRLKEGLSIQYETDRAIYFKRVGSVFHMLYNFYEI